MSGASFYRSSKTVIVAKIAVTQCDSDNYGANPNFFLPKLRWLTDDPIENVIQ
jgi:hypothetical protein